MVNLVVQLLHKFTTACKMYKLWSNNLLGELPSGLWFNNYMVLLILLWQLHELPSGH